MIDSILKDLEGVLPPKAFLTVEDVANALGCSKQSVYNWTRLPMKQRPPRIPVGREVRFPRTEFVRWLAEVQIRA